MGKEINTAANPFFLDNASTTSDGLMSAADKAKLDSLSPSGATGNFTFVGNTMDLVAPAAMQIGDVTTTAMAFDVTTGPYRWQFGSVDTMTLTSANLLQFRTANSTVKVAAGGTDVAGGNMTLAAGDAGPASASGGKAGGELDLRAGNGAAGTATRSAGQGGSFFLFAGDGGTNGGFSGNDGGAGVVVGGNGSAAVGSGAAGQGGGVDVRGGAGGQASGSAASGPGGDTTVLGGNGGDSPSPQAAGNGGGAFIRGGTGGTGFVTGGNGGSTFVEAGFGASPNGVGGSTFVRGGNGAGGTGSVTIGDSGTAAVAIGADGITTTLTGTVSLPGAATGQKLISKNNASNFSAQATWQDSNSRTHFGIDAAGLPSLGSRVEFRDNVEWTLGLVGTTTSPVPNSTNRWVYINTTSGGLTAVTSTTSPASIALKIDPGTAINSVGLLWTNGNILSPQNLTNLYVVMEWEAQLSIVGANNVTYAMGLANANVVSTTHPGGWYFQKASANTNWQCITDDAATTNSQDSGVPPVANTPQAFRIEFYGSGSFTGVKTVKFYINNALVATSTTNVFSTGTVGMQFGGKVTAAAAAQGLTLGPIMLMFNRVATPLSP